MNLTLQYLLIGLLVAGSIVYMLRKLAPQLWLRWQTAWAASLDQPSHSAAVRSFGRFLQPKQGESGGCHSGGDSSCSACKACAPDEPASSAEQPLTFHPRHR